MSKRTEKTLSAAAPTVELENRLYHFVDLNGVEYCYKGGDKARYFSFILYEDSAIENWRNVVDDIIQWPYAYCTHDKDKVYSEEGFEVVGDRKAHTHFIIALPNGSTTYKAVLDVVKRLGKVNCLKTVQSIRGAYDYLIHNTKKAREEHKHLYDVSERIEGNDFDIGAYVQLSEAEVVDIKKELTLDIVRLKFYDYQDFMIYVLTEKCTDEDDMYFRIASKETKYFESVIKGNYLKLERQCKHKMQEQHMRKKDGD